MSDAAGGQTETAAASADGAACVNLGDLGDLRDGQMTSFPELGTHGVVVCRVDGQLRALVDKCSHADTPLSSGRLRGPVLVCPLHGAGFDVRDGSVQGPPAWEDVATHAISETADGAMVDLTPRLADDGGAAEVGARLRTR
ncbi:Rieske (2Fe-2S) protein [Candidatus Poriferisodalis sp.]|uniref:Rieske (2Fe-2S) protein n=1 Tax=Candidatus Poriferisodalis sp. TaxID=3101277 RepID=UPI003B01D474